MKPWYVEVFGATIELGDYITLIAAPDKRVRLSVWPETPGRGRIRFGNYCLICPGVRIGAASEITIGDNTMLASSVYVTDSDWHGIYDRIAIGQAEPVTIGENVWIGDSTIVCKGVTIGDNSIIGAGAVVVKDIPANVVAAGNPARIVKDLDPTETLTKRSHWFSDPSRLARDFDLLDRATLRGNTMGRWLRTLIAPTRND
ncbi:MAG: acyltransferase [Desulfobacterales bacterium]|nr:acyltransferase [Desulfobacterales bacterium]